MTEKEREIVKLHSQGLQDTEIASILNMHRKTVGKIRNRLNLPVHEKYLTFRPKITKLVEEGLNDSEIAKILNINTKSVCYARKRYNLRTNFKVKKYFNKYDKIKGYWLRNIRHSSVTRNLEYNLTIDDFELPVTCPILGFPLDYDGSANAYNNPTIDRIDNSKGYIKGNVIIMSRLANLMKNKATLDELITFCVNITKLVNFYKDQGALGDITDVFPDIKIYKET